MTSKALMDGVGPAKGGWGGVKEVGGRGGRIRRQEVIPLGGLILLLFISRCHCGLGIKNQDFSN